MRSSRQRPIAIRPLTSLDRPAVSEIVTLVGNFNQAEIDCALELIDIYLRDVEQRDYRVVVAEDSGPVVQSYACWGPTPLTRGTYDVYWIATHPNAQGKGFGRALMSFVELSVEHEGGRLLVVETSSKESYGSTVGFYRSLGYEEASRIRDFYDMGDDKLTFVKRFPR
jgi:ribosomal protein S18 acetylase RimI-like enzyme